MYPVSHCLYFLRKKLFHLVITFGALLIGLSSCTPGLKCFGRSPRGARLEMVRQSPQWGGKKFHNVHRTPIVTIGKNQHPDTSNIYIGTGKNIRPKKNIPSIKTNLRNLPKNDDIVVWLGHSSVLIQIGGKRFLIDPILTNKLPTKLFMKPFPGADIYTPEDIPEVDYLIITHNHWDHLDYNTAETLKDSIGTVYCSLGIGEFFSYWDYPEKKIHDMDWNDSVVLDNNIVLHCLPARHYSRRFSDAGKTLWASFLIESRGRRIFISGDSGYDTHFKAIGERFPNIDLAILENGQYDTQWEFLHTFPSQLPQVIENLGARRVMTYHNSKYALANHAWTEPMELIFLHSQGKPWILLTPRIGEPVLLDSHQEFAPWWR